MENKSKILRIKAEAICSAREKGKSSIDTQTPGRPKQNAVKVMEPMCGARRENLLVYQ